MTRLILPGDLADPFFACEICGAQFSKQQLGTFERHVAHCADQHEEGLREQSDRVRAPGLFAPGYGDPEFHTWMRQHRRAILEGRKRM